MKRGHFAGLYSLENVDTPPPPKPEEEEEAAEELEGSASCWTGGPRFSGGIVVGSQAGPASSVHHHLPAGLLLVQGGELRALPLD